ncbi:MAG: 3-methyl-2-oxobutanoate dehydrogenase subunit VorB [Christensenellales bacterium]|jgi:2-oxoglutarate ferredoxin oxidoreductase subunit alpha
MARKLMKGNEAIAEAAIQAGCTMFFGYPITPQNELPEYMSRRLPETGGCFLQAESEVAAINMVYGAAGAGARVMTSSSSPGISLKQEGISYIACAQLPCVIVNMVRGGPGLGGILPAQSDYFQATKGGGHGDYRMIVLAPATLQEAAELMAQAFDLADFYRMPVMLMGDGMLGQIMEPVDLDAIGRSNMPLPEKDWAATGWDGKSRERAIINSLLIEAHVLEAHIRHLEEKYADIAEKHTQVALEKADDAQILVVAYGTTARIAKAAVDQARAEGIRAGLVRPITLWPFPTEAIANLAAKDDVKGLLTVEMSSGQMVEDVRLAVNGAKPVRFFGRTGGVVPSAEEILDQLRAMNGGE